jgi:hypothetical protein
VKASAKPALGGGARQRPPSASAPEDARRIARTLARSWYRQLRHAGLPPEQVVAIASELIDCVSRSLRARRRGEE